MDSVASVGEQAKIASVFSSHQPVADDGVLGQLASSFNQMLDSLSRTMVSRRFLDRVLHSMTEMILVLDADGRVIRVNAAFELTAGRPTLAILGQRIEALFSDELGERLKLAGENVIEAELLTEVRATFPYKCLLRLSVTS